MVGALDFLVVAFEEEDVLGLACALRIEKIGTPILLGNAATIQAKTIELGSDLKDVQIVS